MCVCVVTSCAVKVIDDDSTLLLLLDLLFKDYICGAELINSNISSSYLPVFLQCLMKKSYSAGTCHAGDLARLFWDTIALVINGFRERRQYLLTADL